MSITQPGCDLLCMRSWASLGDSDTMYPRVAQRQGFKQAAGKAGVVAYNELLTWLLLLFHTTMKEKALGA